MPRLQDVPNHVVDIAEGPGCDHTVRDGVLRETGAAPLERDLNTASDLVVLEVRVEAVDSRGDRVDRLEFDRSSEAETFQLGRSRIGFKDAHDDIAASGVGLTP